MKKLSFSAPVIRWIKFNLVGAIGTAVQLLFLVLLTAVFRVNYMLATALAVEATVLHNFVWHEQYTWANCGAHDWRTVSARLLRFNITTGAVSVGGNLLFMWLLVGEAHLPAFVANLASVAGCSLLNFAASDRWVFRPAPHVGSGTEDDVRLSRRLRIIVEPENGDREPKRNC